MKKQTTIILSCITFVLGFFSGVLLTIHKSESLCTSPAAEDSVKDIEKMARALETKAAQNPKNPAIWTQLGNAYFDSNRYEKAIGAYEKSVQIDPNNADVLTDLGILYRRTAQPEKAIKFFDKAITVDPKHEMSRFNKGIVLLHDLNDRDGAIRVWEELLEINPLAMASRDQSVDQLVKHYKEHVKDTSN